MIMEGQLQLEQLRTTSQLKHGPVRVFNVGGRFSYLVRFCEPG